MAPLPPGHDAPDRLASLMSGNIFPKIERPIKKSYSYSTKLRIERFGYILQKCDEFSITHNRQLRPIDLLAILQKSLDGAIFLYNFIREVR